MLTSAAASILLPSPSISESSASQAWTMRSGTSFLSFTAAGLHIAYSSSADNLSYLAAQRHLKSNRKVFD